MSVQKLIAVALVVAVEMTGRVSGGSPYVRFSDNYLGGIWQSPLTAGSKAWPDLFESRIVSVSAAMEGIHTTFPTSIVESGTKVTLTCPYGKKHGCDVLVLVHNCKDCDVPKADLGELLLEGWTAAGCGPKFQVRSGGATHPMRGYYKLLRSGASVEVKFEQDVGLVAFAISGLEERRGCSSYASCPPMQFCPHFSDSSVPGPSCSAKCPEDETHLRSCTETSKDVQLAVELWSYITINAQVGGKKQSCTVDVQVVELLGAPLNEQEKTVDFEVKMLETVKTIDLVVAGRKEPLRLQQKHRVDYKGTVHFSGETDSNVLFASMAKQEYPPTEEYVKDNGSVELQTLTDGFGVDVMVDTNGELSLLPSADNVGRLGTAIAGGAVKGGNLEGFFDAEISFVAPQFVTSATSTSAVYVEGQVYPRCWGAPLRPAPLTVGNTRCVLKDV